MLQTQGGELEAARPRRLEGRNLKEKVVGSVNAVRGVRAERRALVQMGALTAGGMGSLWWESDHPWCDPHRVLKLPLLRINGYEVAQRTSVKSKKKLSE